MPTSSSGSCKFLRNLRSCGTGRSCCIAVSSFRESGFGYGHRSTPCDPAPTSVCVICAFPCVNLASPPASGRLAGCICVCVTVCVWLLCTLCPGECGKGTLPVDHLNRFDWPPRWCVALGGARMKGFVVADTRTDNPTAGSSSRISSTMTFAHRLASCLRGMRRTSGSTSGSARQRTAGRCHQDSDDTKCKWSRRFRVQW